MKALTLDDFKRTLTVVDSGKVSALLTNLGYVRESVTPELLARASAEKGNDFNIPYGQILQLAVSNRQNRSFFEGSKGLEWFNSVSKFLLGGAGEVPKIVNSINGTDQMMAQATLENEMRMSQYNAQRNSRLIIGIVAALVVVVVVVVVIVNKK